MICKREIEVFLVIFFEVGLVTKFTTSFQWPHFLLSNGINELLIYAGNYVHKDQTASGADEIELKN